MFLVFIVNEGGNVDNSKGQVYMVVSMAWPTLFWDTVSMGRGEKTLTEHLHESFIRELSLYLLKKAHLKFGLKTLKFLIHSHFSTKSIFLILQHFKPLLPL